MRRRAAREFARREDVLGDREVAEEVQLLKHDADAVRRRVGGVGEHDGLAVEQDATERRAFDAGDDFHQGRLARAVLADQHIDRAAPDLEIGLFDRDRAGIDLGHALEPQHHVVVARLRSWRADRASVARARPGVAGRRLEREGSEDRDVAPDERISRQLRERTVFATC